MATTSEKLLHELTLPRAWLGGVNRRGSVEGHCVPSARVDGGKVTHFDVGLGTMDYLWTYSPQTETLWWLNRPPLKVLEERTKKWLNRLGLPTKRTATFPATR